MKITDVTFDEEEAVAMIGYQSLLLRRLLKELADAKEMAALYLAELTEIHKHPIKQPHEDLKCPKCRGWGTLVHEIDCDACGGTGTIKGEK